MVVRPLLPRGMLVLMTHYSLLTAAAAVAEEAQRQLENSVL